MDPQTIERCIERIRNSAALRDKAQLRALLEILHRHRESQELLKPDRVIRELWPEEAERKNSADVATEVNRLRRSLETYYESEGASDPVRIYLPNRSVPGPDGRRERRWLAAEPRAVCVPAAEPEPAIVPPLPEPRLPRRASRWPWLIAALLLVALAATLTGRLRPFWKSPASAQIDETTLSVLDAEATVLWRKAFPDGFSSTYYKNGVAPRLWTGALDGKGHTRVLFLYHPANGDDSRSSTLICYSRTGRELWRWQPSFALPELNGSPAAYHIVEMLVLDPDASGRRRIALAIADHVQYPSAVLLFDADGRLLRQYWHSGHFDHLAVARLAGERQQTLLATGISNGYHQATLVALDPDRMEGASAELARPELQIHGFPPPRERLRLLFPRSDLNRALSEYNEAGALSIDASGIRCPILESRLLPQGTLVYYEFDLSLRLRDAVVSDAQLAAHREFYLHSSPSHTLDQQEQDSFRRIRCLSGCSGDYLPEAGR